MQQDIWQHYQTNYPGQVQVVGVDEYNGTTTQLRSFRDQTGATYPLLLQGASTTGGNFATLYGTFDNYVVVNKQGIVRYHAALTWPHGNRYHLNEIRGCVDSLVAQVTEAGPDGPPPAFRLGSAPNPARGATRLELSLPAGSPRIAQVTVHDIGGRHVATVWNGTLPAGTHRLPWSQTGSNGARLAPGVYLVRAQIGATRLVHRVVVLP